MTHPILPWITDGLVRADEFGDAYVGIFDQINHGVGTGYQKGEEDHAYMVASVLILMDDAPSEISEAIDNARFIVQAVNSHDAMVKVLRELLDEAITQEPFSDPPGMAVLLRARAALSAASPDTESETK